MFLKHKPSNSLVEVLTLHELWDPCIHEITGRYHAGQEMQEPESFLKTELVFPSNEVLPQCWIDPHYRDRGVLLGHPETIMSR